MLSTNNTQAEMDLHPPQIYQIQELTLKQKDMIKASIPILELLGEILTAKFYEKMISENDSVKPFFNDTNQNSLKQPKILAFALLHYAKNIDDISPLINFVNQIVVKHVGLQIQAEHYPIVGNTLLATMANLLGDEIATPEFLKSWEIAYGNLAQILINAEFEAYQKLQWKGFKTFKITKSIDESSDVKSIYFTPSDGSKIAIPKIGQYVGIRWQLPHEKFEKSREYSLSEFPTGNEYRISVKKLKGGVISGYVHEHLKVGDSIRVAPPAGQFTYKDNTNNNDILLFVGGIGITPIIPILNQALLDGKKVTLYNSNKTVSSRPFYKHFSHLKLTYPDKFTLREYFTQESNEGESNRIDIINYKSLSISDFDDIDFSGKYDIYVLGPVSYMNFVKSELVKRGINESDINSEFYGPTNV